MPSNLYEILGLRRDATSEEVRKAYKKKALQTHPDRLPPGATVEQKANADETFRIVNNAYEVLSNPRDRDLYDRHGVWPPPSNDTPRSSRHRNHHDPFGGNPFGSRPQFHDPFEMFHTHFFSDFPFMEHGHFQAGRDRDQFRGFPGFGPSFPFGNSGIHPFPDMFTGSRNMFSSPFDSMMPRMGGFGFGNDSLWGSVPDSSRGNVFSSSETVSMGMSDGRWVSQSRKVTNVNGVQRSITERVDREGNVHVTTTHPDGRETLTINGVEKALEGAPPPTNNSLRHKSAPYAIETTTNNTSRVDDDYRSHRQRDGDRHYRHHEKFLEPVTISRSPDAEFVPEYPSDYYENGYSTDHSKRKWWKHRH